MMTKEDWEKLYGILDREYSNFLMDYPQSEKGKNQKIRKTASARVKNQIDLCCMWIERYGEAYQLATGEDASDFGRKINWDEFQLPRYFKNDMRKFLQDVKDKINSFE